MDQLQETSIQKLGLRNGIVAGILSIVYTLVLYTMGGEWMFKTSIQMLGNVFLVGTMIYTVHSYRKAHGNYVSFKQAFGGAFSVGVLGILIPLVFAYLLYAFIDPELTMRLKDYSVKVSIEMFQWFNMSEEQIEEALDKIKEQDYSPTVANYAKGYAGGLLMGALFAVIIALVFWIISRKNEPTPDLASFGTDTDQNILDN
jgi:hypothetical protein